MAATGLLTGRMSQAIDPPGCNHQTTHQRPQFHLHHPDTTPARSPARYRWPSSQPAHCRSATRRQPAFLSPRPPSATSPEVLATKDQYDHHRESRRLSPSSLRLQVRLKYQEPKHSHQPPLLPSLLRQSNVLQAAGTTRLASPPPRD